MSQKKWAEDDRLRANRRLFELLDYYISPVPWRRLLDLTTEHRNYREILTNSPPWFNPWSNLVEVRATASDIEVEMVELRRQINEMRQLAKGHPSQIFDLLPHLAVGHPWQIFDLLPSEDADEGGPEVLSGMVWAAWDKFTDWAQRAQPAAMLTAEPEKPPMVTAEKLILGEGAFFYRGHRQALPGYPLKILSALAKAPDLTLSLSQIQSNVWDGYSVDDGTIRSHVSAVRTALRAAMTAAGVDDDKDPVPAVARGEANTAWRLELP